MKRLSVEAAARGRAAVKSVCFLLLLALALGRADRIFALKNEDGLYDTMRFYELERDSVDLLVLGSSHAFVNIHTGALWEEHGIPAYVLGGGVQPFWNTYYYLKEALKSQSPRLVVLEAFTTTFRDEYNDNGRAVSNTFGLKWSRNKAEAILVSAPRERWKEMLLGWCQYHTRYRTLSREDFLDNKGDEAQYSCRKGFWPLTAAAAFERPDVFQVSERAPMTAKTENWYRKTIELAQAEGVPLLIIVSPYPDVTAADQAVFNTAADIAAEYGVPFVNYNLDYDGLGLDFSADFADGSHLNIVGSRKLASALGDLIAEKYALPDRRGETGYSSWEDNARYLAAAARDYALRVQAASPEGAAALLRDPELICAAAAGGSGGEAFAPLLEALGAPAGEEGLWLASGGKVLWAGGPGEAEEYFCLDYHDLKLSRASPGQGPVNGMVYDGVSLNTAANGVTVFVYDTVTQTQAAYLSYDAAGAK